MHEIFPRIDLYREQVLVLFLRALSKTSMATESGSRASVAHTLVH